MIQGAINLTLMAGPMVPLPVPKIVIDSLEEIRVTSAAGSASGFQMSFTFSNQSELNTIFLIAGAVNETPVTPALRMARSAASAPRSEVNSSSAAMRRSLMPVRVVIHSSVV